MDELEKYEYYDKIENTKSYKEFLKREKEVIPKDSLNNSFVDNNDENGDFIDDLLISRNSNSNRFRAYENSYRNSRNSLEKDKIKNNNELKDIEEKECSICFDKIESAVCKNAFERIFSVI